MLLFRSNGGPKSDGSITYLGESTSYNIKTILPNEDYTALTKDNFIVMPKNNLNSGDWKYTSSYTNNCSGCDFDVSTSATATYNCNKNYNPTTGILTCSISTSAGNPGVQVYFYKE